MKTKLIALTLILAFALPLIPSAVTVQAAETTEYAFATFSGSLSKGNESNSYQFTLENPGRVSLSFEHDFQDRGAWSWDIIMFDDSGKILEFSSTEATPSVTSITTYLGIGAYNIQVKKRQYLSELSYTLTVNYTENVGQFEIESNNARDTATVMDLNKGITGNIHVSGDQDFYKFTLASPGQVSLLFEHGYQDRGAWSWDILLFDNNNGKVLEFVSTEATPSVTSLNAYLDTGIYTVQVKKRQYQSELSYTLTVNYTENVGQFEIEPNNGRDSATSMDLNKGITGNLHISGDQDFYKFTLINPGQVSLLFEHSFQDRGAWSWDILLFNNTNGKLLEFASTEAVPSVTSKTVDLDAGTYTVHIKKRQYMSVLDYVLTVNASNQPTSEPTPKPLTTDPLDSASDWAKEAIKNAINNGYVPPDLQSNYKNVISRQEFCRMAVEYMEFVLGKDVDTILTEKGLSRNPNPFSDTSDPFILAAYALKITNGTSADTFTPNGEFSREQAATMIMNTCRAMGADVNNPPASGFADINATSSWAVNGVNFCYANKIMNGVGDNMFSPKATYTREQSIMTFNNIKFDALPKANATSTLPKPEITEVITSPFSVSGTCSVGTEWIEIIITSADGSVSYLYGDDGIPQVGGFPSFKFTHSLSFLPSGDYAVFARAHPSEGITPVDSEIKYFTLERVGAPQNVLDWIEKSKGKKYGEDEECVIYINYYLTEFWGMTTAGKINSAYQIFDTSMITFPEGWRIEYTEGFVPQPGDIAVWGQNWYSGSKHGHVAIVVEGSTKDQVVVYDQWDGRGAVGQSIYTHANRKNFLGVIRPAYN
jgi:hypothetical protein